MYVTYDDSTVLERDYVFYPKTDIRTGLRNFAKWYKKYYSGTNMEMAKKIMY